MVLVQHHPLLRTLQTQQAQLDVARIFGMAGALSINLIAFMLLMVPVTAPSLPVIAPEEPRTTWIERKKIEPPKPPVVEVSRPTKTASTTTTKVAKPIDLPVNIAPIVIPDGNVPVDSTVEPIIIAPTGVTNVAPDPQPSTRLEYASAPAPVYPREALLDGIEGTVYLKVLVGIDGKPVTVEIERSSGNRKLDEAARRQVLKKWSFRPAIKNGQAIQVYGIVPLSFKLNLQ